MLKRRNIEKRYESKQPILPIIAQSKAIWFDKLGMLLPINGKVWVVACFD